MTDFPFYDPDGNLISMSEWGELFRTHKRIQQTTIRNCWISTVWLGIDYGLNSSRPIIFETMIFKLYRHGGWGDDLYMHRYATQREARKGHYDACRMVRSGFGKGK